MAGLSSTGVVLDPYWSTGLTGSFTAGTWYDTGFNRDSGVTGTYTIRAYVNTFHSGASMYYCLAVSAPFQWHPYPSNAGSRCFINLSSPWMGHAPNSFTSFSSLFEISILHASSPSGAVQRLQFKPSVTLSGLNSTDGRSVEFAIYKNA
jgi:hypothetical protein